MRHEWYHLFDYIWLMTTIWFVIGSLIIISTFGKNIFPETREFLEKQTWQCKIKRSVYRSSSTLIFVLPFTSFYLYHIFFDLYLQVTVLSDHNSSNSADKSAPRFVQLLPEESIVMENHCHEFQTGVTGRIVLNFMLYSGFEKINFNIYNLK